MARERGGWRGKNDAFGGSRMKQTSQCYSWKQNSRKSEDYTSYYVSGVCVPDIHGLI